jgi:hypothetical protein
MRFYCLLPFAFCLFSLYSIFTFAYVVNDIRPFFVGNRLDSGDEGSEFRVQASPQPPPMEGESFTGGISNSNLLPQRHAAYSGFCLRLSALGFRLFSSALCLLPFAFCPLPFHPYQPYQLVNVINYIQLTFNELASSTPKQLKKR